MVRTVAPIGFGFLLAFAVGIAAHMGRYEIAVAPNVLVVLDRWTGDVNTCFYPMTRCSRVHPSAGE